jgi:hypothetical protein
LKPENPTLRYAPRNEPFFTRGGWIALAAFACVALILMPSLYAFVPDVPERPVRAAARGLEVYGPNCAVCHGADSRGGETAPDLGHSTAITGDQAGSFLAYDADVGKILRHFPLGVVQMNFPESFLLGGRQFIVAAGGDTLYGFYLQ